MGVLCVYIGILDMVQTKVGLGVLYVYIGVLDMLIQAKVRWDGVCSDAGKCR